MDSKGNREGGNSMRIWGLATLGVAALLVGGRLTMAAFAPVLPPGFASWTDESYDHAVVGAWWGALAQFEYAEEHGHWARTLEDLFPGWDPEDLEKYFAMGAETDGAFLLRAGDPVDEGRSSVECSVSATAEQGRVLRSRPNWRRLWGTTLYDQMTGWERFECRRVNRPWTWLSWAGLDRVSGPPPERYSALDFADRASASAP